jgi:3-isopropylmalate/(R)-2-methylmalate dehydratase small subunit
MDGMAMHDGWRTRGTAHVLGHNVEHDGPIMPQRLIMGRIMDPDKLIPHLFEALDPTLLPRLKSGDFIVAGRNFGCGKPHINGYIAMQAMGLRLLCESMPGTIVRATMGVALPCLHQCEDITRFIKSGDEIEVDYQSGDVVCLETGEKRTYPPLQEEARAMVLHGGVNGMLAHWLKTHPELRESIPTVDLK